MANRFDAIVFDFDGTILETETAVYESARQEVEAVGHELTLDYWRKVVGTPAGLDWLKTVEHELGDNFDRKAVFRRRRETVLKMVEQLDPRPGVLDLMVAAEEADMALAVATSSPKKWVDAHLNRLGLFHRFGAVCSSDDVDEVKPAPDLFSLAAKRIGVSADRCVAIEDTPHGAVAAKSAGMAVIVAPNDITQGSEFPAADLVVADLAQLEVAEFIGLAAHP